MAKHPCHLVNKLIAYHICLFVANNFHTFFKRVDIAPAFKCTFAVPRFSLFCKPKRSYRIITDTLLGSDWPLKSFQADKPYKGQNVEKVGPFSSTNSGFSSYSFETLHTRLCRQTISGSSL